MTPATDALETQDDLETAGPEIASPEATVTARPPARRCPQLGDELIFNGAKAIQIKIYCPTDPNTLLDILITEGGRRAIRDGVSHDPQIATRRYRAAKAKGES